MLIHHPTLRVNALVPDDDDAQEIRAESGWVRGEHPDTDPDDPNELRAVLPAPTVDDVVQAIKATTKTRKAT